MNAESKKLIKEIDEILTGLDSDDLQFLKEQAAVLAYNKEVIKRREQAIKEIKENSKKGADKNRQTLPSKEKTQAVRFEQIKNGKFFNLCIGNEKLFMDFKEIKAIYNIAQSAENPAEGGSRLYRWFNKERKDVLVDGGISSSSHRALPLIYHELLDTFTSD